MKKISEKTWLISMVLGIAAVFFLTLPGIINNVALFTELPDPINDILNSNNDDENIMRVSWDSNGNPSGTEYVVQRSSDSGATYTTINTTTSLSHDDRDVLGNFYYCYRISSKNQIGEQNPLLPSRPFSPNVNLKCDYTLANAPINIVAIMQPTMPIGGAHLPPYQMFHNVEWNPNENSGQTTYEIDTEYENPQVTGRTIENIPGDILGGVVRIRLDTIKSGANSCSLADGQFYCIQPDQKIKYNVLALNVNNQPTTPTPSLFYYTPINEPISLTQSRTVVPTGSSSRNIEVGWQSNANPETSKYVVCRSKINDATGQPGSYNCLNKNALGIYVDTGIACDTTLTQDKLDILGTNAAGTCTLHEADDNIFIDTVPETGSYKYKLVGVNRGCLVDSLSNTLTNTLETLTPTDPSFQSCSMSIPSEEITSTSTGLYLWTLTYFKDFLPGTQSSVGTQSNVIQGQLVTTPYVYNTYTTTYLSPNVEARQAGAAYDNGAIVLTQIPTCVPTVNPAPLNAQNIDTPNCRGIVEFVFTPGEKSSGATLTSDYTWKRFFIDYDGRIRVIFKTVGANGMVTECAQLNGNNGAGIPRMGPKGNLGVNIPAECANGRALTVRIVMEPTPGAETSVRAAAMTYEPRPPEQTSNAVLPGL